MNPTRHSNILIPKFLISTTFPVNADISKSFFDDILIKLNISSLKLKNNLKQIYTVIQPIINNSKFVINKVLLLIFILSLPVSDISNLLPQYSHITAPVVTICPQILHFFLIYFITILISLPFISSIIVSSNFLTLYFILS